MDDTVLLDTKIGQMKKADPADVAKDGFEAMMKGETQVISGLSSKLEAAFAHVAPADVVAERHRTLAEPGSGERKPG
jgi:short-subunit dehydrogenase